MRKITICLALALAFVLASFCPAQTAPDKRPMTFEDLMKMKRLGDTAISPDGKWLAYGVTTVNLDQNTKTAELWIQAIAGPNSESQAPKKLDVARPGDSGIQFASDGHSVLFLSSREGGQQVWTADFDASTGASANPKKLTAISTEAGDALWSPDGNSILFTSAVNPDCPAITAADAATGDKCNADRDAAAAASKVKAQIFTHLLYRHWNHFTGDKRSHLFLLTIATGALRDLTPNDPHDVPPFSLEGGGCGCAFAPDSRELSFTENLDPEPAISVSAKIFTLDLTNPAAKPVAISTSAGGNFNPAYSPDGKYIAWRSEARAGYESDKFRLALYDRAAKTVKDLLPKFDNWVEEFAWAPDSQRLYFISTMSMLYSTSAGISRSFILSLDGALEHFYDSGTLSDLQPLADNHTVLVVWGSISRPGEVILLSVEALSKHEEEIATHAANILHSNAPTTSLHFKQLTNLNGRLLVQLDLSALDYFWFTADDGVKLQGFILKPPAFDAKKKYPVKFLIHGGPQGAWGDSWSYRWNAELFAANGYVVVMINPRGSTGYGQAFVDGVNGDWGGKPFTDLLQGLDYAEQHYPFIDKSRECALGASYGGFMANWILGHTDRFKCIVSHDGMFNPESAYGTTEELWFNEWEFKGKPWDYYGKQDAENPFRKWSPAMSAKNFKTPTLVIHSQLDYRLDVAEGFQLFTTLQRLNVPSKMLYFPDEGHWVLKPQNSRLWYKTVNDWVDQWTK